MEDTTTEIKRKEGRPKIVNRTQPKDFAESSGLRHGLAVEGLVRTGLGKPGKAMNLSKRALTFQQEAFCREYIYGSNGMGSSVESYANVFGEEYPLVQKPGESEVDFTHRKWNLSAKASRLIRKPKVRNRLMTMLNDLMTDEEVDAQLSKVIQQDKQLDPKVSAIREYNKLEMRIVDRQDLTSMGQPLTVEISEVIARKNGIIMPEVKHVIPLVDESAILPKDEPLSETNDNAIEPERALQSNAGTDQGSQQPSP